MLTTEQNGLQRTDTFTGIQGINTQDRATQESMGKLVDRTKEHLGPADRAIIVCRKLLADAISTVADGGEPPGVAPTYYTIRAIDAVVPADRDWRDEILAAMYPSEPAGSVR